MRSNIEKQQELWAYVFKLFPVFDIVFGILCVLYSDDWLLSLLFFPLIPLTAGIILSLSVRRKFQPGRYIFFFNSINFIAFAWISGSGSPSWLLLINVCIGSSFLFENPRIGQAIVAFYTILTAVFFYYMGASVVYCLSFGGALLAFTTLFARTHDYLSLKHKEIQDQKKLIEDKNKNIGDNIHYAKRLQNAILPPENYWKKHLPESFIYYSPKDIVSGDFYWMEKIDEGILFAAADCTGHGVSGAMLSVVCSNAINRTVKELKITEPAKILDKTRQVFLETFAKSESDIKEGMDISLCFLNTSTNVLTWSGANNPLWHISKNKLHELKGDKQSIGSSYEPKPFSSHKIELQSEDAFYIFTDGFADQFGGLNGKKLMKKRFKEMLLQIHHLTMTEQRKYIDNFMEEWKSGAEQVDDILVIGVRV